MAPQARRSARPCPAPGPWLMFKPSGFNAEAFPAQDQHGVGSCCVAGARRRRGSTNMIGVSGSLLSGTG